MGYTYRVIVVHPERGVDMVVDSDASTAWREARSHLRWLRRKGVEGYAYGGRLAPECRL